MRSFDRWTKLRAGVDLEGELEGAREEVTTLGERVKAELIQSGKGAETAVQQAEAAKN